MSDHRSRSSQRLTPLTLALLVVVLLVGSTGGAVAGALITGKQIKDGTVTGKDIKDGSLTAVDTADEPTVWQARASSFLRLDSGIYAPVVSRTVTTRAGYLAITGTIYTEDSVPPPIALTNYRLVVDGRTASTDVDRYLNYSAAGAGANGAATLVVPVKAGKHTISLQARELNGESFVYFRELTIVYTPTGSVTGPALVPAG